MLEGVDLDSNSMAEVGAIDVMGAMLFGAREVAMRLARRLDRIIIVADLEGNGCVRMKDF